MQLHNWIAQNAAANVNEDAANEVAAQEAAANVQFQPQWGVWPPSPPHSPPAVFNFQAWLAGEGLQVYHGVHPSNNMQDSPAAAWNDSISIVSSSDSSATLSDGYALVPLNIFSQLIGANGSSLDVSALGASTSNAPARHSSAGSLAVPTTDISMTISNAGLHLQVQSPGNMFASLLINECVPMLRLNTYLLAAIRPITAAYGPWSSGYGFCDITVKLKVSISEHEGLFSVISATRTVQHSEDSAQATEVIPGSSTWTLTRSEDMAVAPNPPKSQVVITEILDENDTAMQATESLSDHSSNTSSGSVTTGSSGSSGNVVSEAATSRRSKAKAPESVMEVRQSNRSNKYDGFKTHSVSDSRARASRVKPRCIPSAAAPSSHGVPDSSKNDMIPPPTPVLVLQQIGISKCAIPPEEITAEVLLAEPEEGPSNA